ncbi:Mal d 1-associated protein [Cinnamomum micranthum f. kanehirae]|uniref:Mal d 1-associated protein n=1 Tax=Cinnamomum micranthum f. kanehirae TaxID=337451 RepID=A0A3S4P492_9MAGN|nr:Mal d 1-associated protein [Cinnamomum micranthum f. kanehirae]
MGWNWRGDSSSSSSVLPLGFGETSDLGNPNPRQEGDRRPTSRIVKSKCKTEEIEPGKFVRKCERTEQLLRESVGRPVEVVESNTEYTEHDVTDEMVRGSLPSSGIGPGPFDFPGLRGDVETLERYMSGGLSQFLDSAFEEMNGFFQAFRKLSEHDRERSFYQRKPADGFFEKEASKQKNESKYTEFAGKYTDV